MSDCLFCGIVAGTVPATIVKRDDDAVAFRDINPGAPTHVLVVPTTHVASAAELTEEHDHIWARVLHLAQEVARDEGLEKGGYRLVCNVGRGAGQSVDHLHLHVLGGRQLSWPPG